MFGFSGKTIISLAAAFILAGILLLALRGVWMTLKLRAMSLEQKLAVIRAAKNQNTSSSLFFSRTLNESKILNQLGRPWEALEVLKAAAAPPELQAKYSLAMAEAYIGLNQPSQAKKMIEAAANDQNGGQPTSKFDMGLAKARLYLMLKNADRAGQYLEETKAAGRGNPYWELASAKHSLLLNDRQAAAEKITRLSASKDEYIAREAKSLARELDETAR